MSPLVRLTTGSFYAKPVKGGLSWFHPIRYDRLDYGAIHQDRDTQRRKQASPIPGHGPPHKVDAPEPLVLHVSLNQRDRVGCPIALCPMRLLGELGSQLIGKADRLARRNGRVFVARLPGGR